MFKIKNIGIWIAIGVTVSGSVGSVVFAIVKSKSITSTLTNSNNVVDSGGSSQQGLGTNLDYFATLNANAIYDDLRIKNNNVIITEDLIGKIISELIYKSHFINKEGVNYSYQISNDNMELIITLEWNSVINSKRTYKINLLKNS